MEITVTADRARRIMFPSLVAEYLAMKNMNGKPGVMLISRREAGKKSR